MTSLIHFNAAGASICADNVVEAQINYLREEQQLGGYLCASNHSEDWQKLYQRIASLILAQEHQIALQESATRAMVSALLSIPWESGDEVIITEFEYGANFVAIHQLAEKYELVIKVVSLREGNINVEDVLHTVSDKTKALIITWVPSHIGTRVPAEEVGRAIKDHHLYYVVDACQVAGQLPIDVTKLHCDFLCATGRKFLRAPRGTGFLYASDRVINDALLPIITDHFATELKPSGDFSLRKDARRFELWEGNWSARLGLSVAIDNLLSNQTNIYKSIETTAKSVREKLNEIPHLTTYENEMNASGIITFNLAQWKASELNKYLLDHSIVTSVSYFDSGPIQMQQRSNTEVNRISVHSYNSLDDINILAEVLMRAATSPLSSESKKVY
ncbi:aminotransferase class V-fold PLP-dependent enzyme [Pleionea sediminis]|uniref:aminotransferase class V-fold PLP-dependent enzyme n=1 Tax=Pleionea sediminis TaxID=2569479 RepID=UPI0013DE1737|nr:aminotransferase class V-fold PLP-dependent enzyme [Pleionea sediminis]